MIGKINLYPSPPSIEDIEGLQEALDKRTATSELLKRGIYNGNASDLKAEIDRKVSKEEGKGLSSNDYTNAEKQKNEENALKKVVGLTVTGDVNKIITITFADSTVMQAPFNDNDHISLPDVNMNSMNFNENTGVLTGVKSDGQEITVSLDGRYSLIGHHHDDRYAQKTHTHPNYAQITHQHNWDDILRKPNNLATNESVKEAIERIKTFAEKKVNELNIVGRNYVLDSKKKRSQKGYYIEFPLSKTLERGQYIASVDVELIKDVGFIGIIPAITGKNSPYTIITLPTEGNKRYFFDIEITGDDVNAITLYPQKGYATPTYGTEGEAIFSNFKLERGNKSTDWSPAPEDIIEQFNTLEQRIAALEAKF